jgi:hypothetical protein
MIQPYVLNPRSALRAIAIGQTQRPHFDKLNGRISAGSKTVSTPLNDRFDRLNDHISTSSTATDTELVKVQK